jgi:hypothetical protein
MGKSIILSVCILTTIGCANTSLTDSDQELLWKYCSDRNERRVDVEDCYIENASNTERVREKRAGQNAYLYGMLLALVAIIATESSEG